MRGQQEKSAHNRRGDDEAHMVRRTVGGAASHDEDGMPLLCGEVEAQSR